MALRFRRSFKIAPGVRLNVGKRGASLSAGVRGASVSAGSRGVYGNVGIPGTGLSVRERLGTGSPGRPPSASSSISAPSGQKIKLALQDDGSVEFQDAAGNPLPQSLQRQARQELSETISTWMEAQEVGHFSLPQMRITV